MNMEVGRTSFDVSMDFDTLDEKLQRFIELRNELAMLAEEIGLEVKRYMLRLEEKK